MTRTALLLVLSAAVCPPASAQSGAAAQADYFHAVAGFFSLPPSEIAILGEWDIPDDEIPVVLFMARRAGVSPEALVALRGSGRSWSSLAARYRVTAAALHVPIREEAPAGSLSRVYEQYRSLPVAEWGSIELTDDDFVGLVNVRVISQSLRMPAEHVIGRAGSTPSYVQLYATLKR